MQKTPHQLIKSRQSSYDHFKDKALRLLIESGTLKTKKIGWASIYGCGGLLVLQIRRVYSDEIPLPDMDFCFNRMRYWTKIKERRYSFSTAEPCYIWKTWGRYLECRLTK